ncbi:MAG: NAD(+)/NADH kinase [Asgard group archaeon]|nr:NAD(+)/NADH kinase [Asgard group archaeon]
MVQFNKIAIVSRLSKSNHIPRCQEVINYLVEKHKLDIYLNKDFAKIMNHSKTVTMEQIKDFDLIIAFGGDGTILWASRFAQEVPIFGINAGHLGFLTTATLDESEAGIDRVMKDDIVYDHCIRLKATLNGKNLPTALNESYTTNKFSANICQLELKVNDFDLGCHLLDGIMVSTPTGSTAYSLSAGGSIIQHSLAAMQIVPVNSVSRRIRPFVVPGDFKITISVPDFFKDDVIVINDGVLEGQLDPNSILEITKASTKTVFVRFPDYDFFKRLQDKLDF